MNPTRFRKLRETFEAAIEREPAKRKAFLEKKCAGDPDLLRELLSLLASHRETDIETSAFLEQYSPLVEGQSVGPYVVRSEIGRGGMGIVYLAEDTRLQRQVALKALAPELFNEKQQERFRREARLAGSLSHPAVATIYVLEEVEGRFYIVSEYVAGKTLRSELEEAPFSVDQVLDTAVQMAGGLAAAHEKGIIHRDLKPENVIRNNEGQLKIVDFGLALMPQPEPLQPHLTESGMVLGTPSYMSPEQLRGQRVDFRSDIFSLGVVLYELACGDHPFRGRTAIATVAKILDSDPPALVNLSQTAPELDELIRKCLRKNPDERYQSTAQIVADLRALGSIREGGLPRKARIPPSLESREGETEEVRLRSSWWAVHQALVLLLYGTMVWVLWHVKEENVSLSPLLAFFGALACAIANGVLRVHLLFTWRFNSSAIQAQIGRLAPWVRGVDWVFTAVLLAAAASIFSDHLRAGVLLAVAIGYLVVFLVVEPATFHAVFTRRRSER